MKKAPPVLVDLLVLEEKVSCTEKDSRACPFCGQLKLSRLTSRNVPDTSWIQCDTCGATGPNTKDRAFGWNIRKEENATSGPKEMMLLVLKEIEK